MTTAATTAEVPPALFQAFLPRLDSSLHSLSQQTMGKGVSAADKKKMMLGVFHAGPDVFSKKEIEKQTSGPLGSALELELCRGRAEQDGGI